MPDNEGIFHLRYTTLDNYNYNAGSVTFNRTIIFTLYYDGLQVSEEKRRVGTTCWRGHVSNGRTRQGHSVVGWYVNQLKYTLERPRRKGRGELVEMYLFALQRGPLSHLEVEYPLAYTRSLPRGLAFSLSLTSFGHLSSCPVNATTRR